MHEAQAIQPADIKPVVIEQQQGNVEKDSKTNIEQAVYEAVEKLRNGGDIYQTLKELKKSFSDNTKIKVHVSTNYGGKDYATSGKYADISMFQFVKGYTISELVGHNINVQGASVMIESVTLSVDEDSTKISIIFNTSHPQGDYIQGAPVRDSANSVTSKPDATFQFSPTQISPTRTPESTSTNEKPTIHLQKKDASKDEQQYSQFDVLIGQEFTVDFVDDLAGQHFRIIQREGKWMLQARDENYPDQWDDELSNTESSHIQLEPNGARYIIHVYEKAHTDIAQAPDASKELQGVKTYDVEGNIVTVPLDTAIQLTRNRQPLGPVIRIKDNGSIQKYDAKSGVWLPATDDEQRRLQIRVSVSGNTATISGAVTK